MKALVRSCLAFALLSTVLGGGPPSTHSCGQSPSPPTSSSSVNDVLNFALNLEYLEAEFYHCAAYGTPLPDDLRGGGPPSQGCMKANLTSLAQGFAEEVAQNEQAHVALLRGALGSQAVPIPQLNIGTAFNAAGNAAFGYTLNPPFSPYYADIFFYHGSFIFEDVGVTAYAGATPSLKESEYLQPAAEILAVEAYHSSLFRTLLYMNRNVVTPYNVTVGEAIGVTSDLRDSVDGPSDDDQNIETSDGQPNIFPVNSNALVYARTPDQVIAIVTLGAGRSGGGFFPNGLNGAFGPGSG